MPELVVGQAGKELTHNQALAVLDQLAQAVVVDKDLTAPPGSPANGSMYIVADGATGAWSGQSGKLAYWLATVAAWTFITPADGWSVWVADESVRYERKVGAWVTSPTRELLTAPRTYYVRTDGSDSNTGLVNTSGGAFQTIQKAVDVSSVLDLSVYNVTIRCTGAFTSTVTLKTLTGAGNVEIRGDASNTTDFSVAVAGGDCFSYGDGFLGLYKLHYMKLSTSVSGSCIRGAGGGGAINYGNIDFGASVAAHISISQGQYCAVDGPITISGSAGTHIQAFDGGSVRENNQTITIIGTPAFTTFASPARAGTLVLAGNTYVGAATGVRYNVNLNGVIFVNGAGASYLPGDTAGVTATGGQYA